MITSPSSIKSDPAFIAIYLTFSAAAIVLMAVFRLLPFVDLPRYLALATICRYIGEPGNLFAQYFQPELWINSNVFYVVFCSWSIWPSVEFGNHVYYAAYAVLLPLSVLLLIRRLGGNVWFALLSFLLIHNFNTMWGFAGYTMAIPLAIFTFHITLNCVTRPSWGWRLAAAVMMFGLFHVHAQMALFSMLIFAVCVVYHHRRRVGVIAVDLLALVPAIILFVAWWQTQSEQPSTLAFLADYYTDGYWRWLYRRLKLLILDNFFLIKLPLGYIPAFLFSLVMIAPLVLGIGRDRGKVRMLTASPDVRLAVVFAVVSLALFLILPQDLPDQVFIFDRVAVLAMLSLIILGSLLYPSGPTRRVKAMLSIVVAIYLAVWFHYYRDFNRQNESFTPDIFPEATDNARVAGLIYDYEFRGQGHYIHFPCYYTVWKHGIATANFMDYRFTVVRRKADESLWPRYLEWEGVRHEYDGRYSDLEYILVRGDIPPDKVPYLQHFTAVKTAGPWVLYENLTK